MSIQFELFIKKNSQVEMLSDLKNDVAYGLYTKMERWRINMKIKTKETALIIILVYVFFYQALFKSSIIKYLIFLVDLFFCLFHLKKIKISSTGFWWILLVAYMMLRSVTVEDLPITLAFVIIVGIFLENYNLGNDQFVKIIILCTGIHAFITIACCLVPALHENIIVPLFYENTTGRSGLSNLAGLTNHYSTNGMYLGLGFICSSINAMICNHEDKKKNILFASLILLGLILTTKRTHLAAAIFSAIIINLIYNKRHGKTLSAFFRIFFIVLMGLSVFLLVASVVPVFEVLVNRFLELQEDVTLHGRTYFYEVAIAQWQSNPLWGTGWGGFSKAFNQTSLGQAYIADGFSKIQPHNVYLQLLSDLGIVGLIIFFIVILGSLSNAISKTKQNINSVTIYSCIGIILYVLVCGLTGNPLNDIQLYCPLVFATLLIGNSNPTNCYS